MSARDENALEPVELINRPGAVLRVGRAMLTSGTGSYRVETAMDQVAHAFGLDGHEAYVTLNEITGTSYRGPIFRTEVAEVHSMGVNSNRIELLTDMVNGLKPGATPDQVMSAVDRIDATPPLHPGWMNALSAGVACGACTERVLRTAGTIVQDTRTPLTVWFAAGRYLTADPG